MVKNLDSEYYIRTKTNLSQYDFTNEIYLFPTELDCIDRIQAYYAKSEGLKFERFNIAKENLSMNIIGKEVSNEADNCKLIKQIYSKLWSKEVLKICASGDTMNSLNNTMVKLYQVTETDEEKKFRAEIGKENGTKRNQQMISKSYLLILFDEDKEKFKYKLSKTIGAIEFFECAYTIGNFIPVPLRSSGKNIAEFNRPREKSTKDYWDLTLYYIYNWYMTKDDLYLRRLLYRKENIEICKEWLQLFGNWHDFVVNNYLQDFIKINKVCKNINVENYCQTCGIKEKNCFGEPKPLWEGHFNSGKSKLPETCTEIEEYFLNATTWISKRGSRMAAKFLEAQSNNKNNDNDSSQI